jgi:hypothetical protein
MTVTDHNDLPGDSSPATATEERLGFFLEEAMKLAEGGGTIDVEALLADRSDLIDRGRRLVEGLKSLRQAAATGSLPTTPDPARPADETPLPDPFPADYRIRRLLGEGTFGKVWLADDLRVGRRLVALKTLHHPADPAALEALRKEADILGNLDHRNVVRVHTWRQAGGEHYLVLEYVAGGSLADLLREEGPMSWQRAAHYVANLAEGLREVHARDVLHRDHAHGGGDAGLHGAGGAAGTGHAGIGRLRPGGHPLPSHDGRIALLGYDRGRTRRRHRTRPAADGRPLPAGSPAARRYHPRRPGGG